MNIVVCVKIVQGEINPFDAAALETALRLGDAHTTVVSMGPKTILPVLEGLTRLGKFRTILISDDLYAGSDTLATSRILAAAVKQLDPTLVFCGRQSIDGETSQVGPCLATMLGFSFVGNVMEFGIPECRTRTGIEMISNPSVLAFERIHSLRFPSLRSQTRNVEVWDNRRLELAPALCGLAGSPTKVLETFRQEQGRRNCRFIEYQELEPLLKKLRTEPPSRVAPKMPDSKNKLKTVWTIGHGIRSVAEQIGENVIEHKKGSIESLAELIREAKPDVVLWSADFWGRNTAPQVAALLETGLCADCTKLSVVEENGIHQLEMYRPALAGNVIARIRCRTRPVMATIRTVQENKGIIVSCGRGAAAYFDEISIFAKRHHAEICASRGLVDMNIAPYEIQVGLTGKHVSPDIYLAVGISGTVQHLCAVENAGTIIAVNPDKNARIFEYADYGIVEPFEKTSSVRLEKQVEH